MTIRPSSFIITAAGTTYQSRALLPLMVFLIIWAGLFAIAPAQAYPTPCVLTVQVSPSPAHVCIDGSTCHVTRPGGRVIFEGVRPGSYHTLTVTRAGYRTFTQSFFADPFESGLIMDVPLQAADG